MFRRQLLRQTRNVSQSTSSCTSPLRQIQRPSFSILASKSARPASLSSQYFNRRWQSTEAEKTEETPAASSDGKETPPASQEDHYKAELEKKNKEVVELKDKYLRSVADYRNLQDRTKRDNANARQFAIQKFAVDLLDSIDNLDRALSAVPQSALGKSEASTTSNTSSADPNVGAPSESTSAVEPNKDLQNLYNGLKMSDSIMMGTLKKHGLERYDPMDGEGRKFDPNLDEATFFTKVEGKQDGDVFYTQSKGYSLNGRVIRSAKVGVVKNS